MDSYGVPLYE